MENRRPPSDVGGHIFLAIALGVGILMFFFGTAGMFEISANICGDGCQGDDLWFPLLAAGSVTGLLGLIAFCATRRYGWWPKTAGLLTLYLWLVGGPLLVLYVLLMGLSVP